MGRRTLKIMDYRLIIILTIYLTEGALGLDCHAMKCDYNVTSGYDLECTSLGDLEDANRTSCAFYPCMKAEGRENRNGSSFDTRIFASLRMTVGKTWKPALHLNPPNPRQKCLNQPRFMARRFAAAPVKTCVMAPD